MDAVNFGDVELGSQMTRVIFLKNKDSIDATYQFMCENDGIFAFQSTQGIIPAGFEVNIVLSFTPTEAGNYYRFIIMYFSHESLTFIHSKSIIYHP